MILVHEPVPDAAGDDTVPGEPVAQAVLLRLYPDATQAAAMRQWIGAARALWNHLLAGQRLALDVREPLFSHKELEAERQRWEAEPGCEWRKAAQSQTRQQVIRDLERAFRDFFRSIKGERKGARLGSPRRKRKLPGGTFYVANSRLALDAKRCRVDLDKLGEMRVRGLRPNMGRILGARVRHSAGRWFLAVQLEGPPPRAYGEPSEPVLGIDVGLKASVARSDGVVTAAPRFYRKAEKKLRRLQRRVSASQRGSRREGRKRQAVARLQARTADCRRDFLHHRSSRIVGKAAVIGIETLSVKGMARGRLAKSVADAGMGELHRQIEYKAAWAGRTVVRADRFEPSTRTCSACGQLHDMPLSRRTMRCECGLVLDRDVNAACNLARVAAELVGRAAPEPGESPTRGETGTQANPKGKAGAGRRAVKGRTPVPPTCGEPQRPGMTRTGLACSSCGAIHDMPLHRRTMRCGCGLEIDRDLNSALDLARIAAGRVGEVIAEPGASPPTDVETGVQAVAARPSRPVPVVEASSRAGASRRGVRGRGPGIPVRTGESSAGGSGPRGPGP